MSPGEKRDDTQLERDECTAGVIYPKLGRYRVTTGINLIYNFSKKSEGHDKARKGLYPQIAAVQLT